MKTYKRYNQTTLELGDKLFNPITGKTITIIDESNINT